MSEIPRSGYGTFVPSLNRGGGSKNNREVSPSSIGQSTFTPQFPTADKRNRLQQSQKAVMNNIVDDEESGSEEEDEEREILNLVPLGQSSTFPSAKNQSVGGSSHQLEEITELSSLLPKKKNELSLQPQQQKVKDTSKQKEIIKQVAEAEKKEAEKELQRRKALQAQKQAQQKVLEKSADPQEWLNEQQGFPSFSEIAYELLPESWINALGINANNNIGHSYTPIPDGNEK